MNFTFFISIPFFPAAKNFKRMNFSCFFGLHFRPTLKNATIKTSVEERDRKKRKRGRDKSAFF